MTVALVLGTRPEIIKLAPVVRALQRRQIAFRIVHTGQHYDELLDRVFFRELALPAPDVNLEVGSHAGGIQTGQMIERLSPVLLEMRPSCVVVQGDTNTVLAGAIASRKIDVPVVHVEAGLRSGDLSQSEEFNRIVADHAADLLLAPTPTSHANLRNEGLPDERIVVTGNTIVDAVQQHLPIALAREGLESGDFAVATIHRAENTDHPSRFAGILDGLRACARSTGLRMILPLHPRAQARIGTFNLDVRGLDVVHPLGYLAFLQTLSQAKLVVTDSGGVQEEACILGVPCVTTRERTERPETIAVRANRVCGTQPDSIAAAAQEALVAPRGWSNPFGDGHAADRTVDAMVRRSLTSSDTILAPMEDTA